MRHVRSLVLYFSLMFTSCSCTGSVQKEYIETSHYDIFFNSTITSVQEMIIVDALVKWQKVLGDKLTFDFRRGEYKYYIVPERGQIHFWGAPGASVRTNIGGQTAVWEMDVRQRPLQSRIWIDTAFDHDMLTQIVTHELGHALGLSHSNNPLSVMYPKIYPQIDVQQDITCSDRRDLCNMWDCEPGCE